MGNARQWIIYALLFVLSLSLMVTGFQGALGRLLAVFVAPGLLTVTGDAGSGGSSSSTSQGV